MGADRIWMTRAEACRIIGCGTANFDQRVRTRLGRSATKGTKGSLRFDAVQVVAAWVAHREEIASASSKPTSATNETELERGRAIDNDRKRLKLMQDLKAVVDISDIREPLLAFAQEMRDAGSQLVRRTTLSGADAQDILIEHIEAGERRIKDHFDRPEAEREAAAARDVGGEPVLETEDD